MDLRDPITLIDESIENLTHLIDWLLEDIDVGALESDLLAKDAIRSIAALRAIRALLPRLRIVRSNFVSAPSLPDATRAPADQSLIDFVDKEHAHLRKLLNKAGGSSRIQPPEVRAAAAMSLHERRMGMRRHAE